MGAGNFAGKMAAPLAAKKAPGVAANFVRQAFDRALDGVGPFRGAVESAERKLSENKGDVNAAVRDIVDSHVQLAGAQGFVTNLGGLATVTVFVPANISGLALLQCHMIAGIAHLHGYELGDPRVRNAVLACMLGEDTVQALIKKRRLPSSPMAIATAPAYDPDLDRRIATEVTSELITRVAGKRSTAAVARRVPIVGGGVGAVTDGWVTYQVGRYANKELKARRKVT